MHWLEQLLKTYGQLKVAGEASSLDDNQKILAMDRRVVEAHHKRTLGPTFQPAPIDSEDDMIHIGDRHDHHHATAIAPTSSSWLKWLLPFALLATGTGGGIGAAMLWNNLTTPPHPVPPAVAPKPSDQDTLFELRLGPPKGSQTDDAQFH